jgi:hypothetical protein
MATLSGCASNERTPPKIERLLATLRAGKTPKGGVDVDELERWLDQTFTKGKTTRKEVVDLFGTHFKNLDRPDRDGVVAIQYELMPNDGANWCYLVLEFDTKTGKLRDCDISWAICGYCPHIFSHDGRWRLEGKMLAGCVGKKQEGVDVVILPRLKPDAGQLRIKIANLAPEIEHLDLVELGTAFLQSGEELDVDVRGQAAIWRPEQELAIEMLPAANGTDETTIDLDHAGPSDVIVIEARNTSKFEAAMRNKFLRHRADDTDYRLIVTFNDGTAEFVEPVGTKFLRRIVVPRPAGATALRIRAPLGHWAVSRLWTGTKTGDEQRIAWQQAGRADGPHPDAAELLRQPDARRLQLSPMQSTELHFTSRAAAPGPGRPVYVLRMRGYYEFVVHGAPAPVDSAK